MKFKGDCPFCNSHLEDIDHLFRRYDFAKEVCSDMIELYLTLVNNHMHFLDWINLIWKDGKVYNKFCHNHLEKVVVIVWSIWTYRTKSLMLKRLILSI